MFFDLIYLQRISGQRSIDVYLFGFRIFLKNNEGIFHFQ